jgi:aspartate 1-decarboxylase
MMYFMLKSKIHGATVTEVEPDYEGSIEIDRNLIEAANLIPYEQVHVWNISNGERLTTYVIEGERGSGRMCLNGAAAHRARPGDKVIIASFVSLDQAELKSHQPEVVLVDDDNRRVEIEEGMKDRLKAC